jgi:hypothetical protein
MYIEMPLVRVDIIHQRYQQDVSERFCRSSFCGLPESFLGILADDSVMSGWRVSL